MRPRGVQAGPCGPQLLQRRKRFNAKPDFRRRAEHVICGCRQLCHYEPSKNSTGFDAPAPLAFRLIDAVLVRKLLGTTAETSKYGFP